MHPNQTCSLICTFNNNTDLGKKIWSEREKFPINEGLSEWLQTNGGRKLKQIILLREKCFHIVIIGFVGITATGEKIMNAQLTGGRPLL